MDLYQGESSRSQELVRRYILQSMKVWLQEDQEKAAAENCRFVYSFPFCAMAIKSLQRLLETSTLRNSLSQKGVLFAQFLRSGVDDIKVPNRNAFKRTNWAVSFLEVTKFDQAGEDSETGTGAGDSTSSAPFILCLEALPLDTLMKMRRWQVEPDLSVSVKILDGMDSELYGTSHCSALLTQLLAHGDFFLQGNDEELEVRQSILTDMANKGLAEQHENTGWSLTSAGKDIVSVSYILKQRQKVVRIRKDVSIDDMETIELLLQLQMNGWKSEAVQGKESVSHVAKSSYIHGEEKIWYQIQDKEAVCREYLRLLLTASTHLQPVPHLQPASVYLKMLGKEPSSRKRRGSMIFLDDEDIWFDESIVKSSSRTAGARASKKRPRKSQGLTALEHVDQGQLAAASTSGVCVAGSDIVEHQPDGESSDGGCSSNGNASSPVSSANPGKSKSSSRSSSARSGSSTHGSGSESGSSSSSSESSSQKPSDDNKPASARGTGVRRERNSEFWGPFRFTPTKSGWQVTCPFHDTDGKAHCTKTRSNNVLGNELATRMLKTWALWGKNAVSKDDHQKRIWKEVCDAQKNNTLPSSDSLDKQV